MREKQHFNILKKNENDICKNIPMPHVGEVDSGIRPKVAFNESAQGLPPCEEDIKRGPDDGRLVGRIGVQVERVESEVVLIW